MKELKFRRDLTPRQAFAYRYDLLTNGFHRALEFMSYDSRQHIMLQIGMGTQFAFLHYLKGFFHDRLDDKSFRIGFSRVNRTEDVNSGQEIPNLMWRYMTLDKFGAIDLNLDPEKRLSTEDVIPMHWRTLVPFLPLLYELEQTEYRYQPNYVTLAIAQTYENIRGGASIEDESLELYHQLLLLGTEDFQNIDTAIDILKAAKISHYSNLLKLLEDHRKNPQSLHDILAVKVPNYVISPEDIRIILKRPKETLKAQQLKSIRPPVIPLESFRKETDRKIRDLIQYVQSKTEEVWEEKLSIQFHLPLDVVGEVLKRPKSGMIEVQGKPGAWIHHDLAMAAENEAELLPRTDEAMVNQANITSKNSAWANTAAELTDLITPWAQKSYVIAKKEMSPEDVTDDIFACGSCAYVMDDLKDRLPGEWDPQVVEFSGQNEVVDLHRFAIIFYKNKAWIVDPTWMFFREREEKRDGFPTVMVLPVAEIFNANVPVTLQHVWATAIFNNKGVLEKIKRYDPNIEKKIDGEFYTRVDSLVKLAKRTRGSDDAMTTKSIRSRFEERRQKYGGKAAWLLILQELGLPEKLGFKIPPFVLFDHEYLKDLAKRYEENQIDKSFFKLAQSVKEIPGPFLDTWSWNNGEKVKSYLRRKEPIPVDLEKIARTFNFDFYPLKLFEEKLSQDEFNKLINQLFDTAYQPLLEFTSREQWIEFFVRIRESADIKRFQENKSLETPLPSGLVTREMRWAYENSIKAFLFFHSLPPNVQQQWIDKIKPLSRNLIWRSSGYDEDTFLTSNAGTNISRTADVLDAIKVLSDMLKYTHNDTITDHDFHIESNLFLQDYIFADASGIIFSNLGGYTTIESVVGEGAAAVTGMNNSIIDLNHENGSVEGLNYGFNRQPSYLRWRGLDLQRRGDFYDDEETGKYVKELWKTHSQRILVKGTEKQSPLNIEQIKRIRDVSIGLEKALGFPVDNEFLFKDGELFIAQLRPITGENATAPQPLPRFKQEDIISEVPITIGSTPANGFEGYIVAGMSYFDVPRVLVPGKNGKKEVWAVDMEKVLSPLGLTSQEVIIAPRDSHVGFSHSLVVINPNWASRVYHHGIWFRENGAVVAGIPGLLEKGLYPITWEEKKVTVSKNDEKGESTLHLIISKEKYKFISNGFRGILVKKDAIPIDSAGITQETLRNTDEAMTGKEALKFAPIDRILVHLKGRYGELLSEAEKLNLDSNSFYLVFKTLDDIHSKLFQLEKNIKLTMEDYRWMKDRLEWVKQVTDYLAALTQENERIPIPEGIEDLTNSNFATRKTLAFKAAVIKEFIGENYSELFSILSYFEKRDTIMSPEN